MFSLTPFIVPFVAVVALILITVSVKIVRQYERAVVVHAWPLSKR